MPRNRGPQGNTSGWGIGGAEIGAVQAFGIAPSSKWALADGTPVTTALGYTTLRAGLIAAGSPYGTSGGNPRLPDLRGRAAIGSGAGAGLTPRVAGEPVGVETHPLTESQMPAHTHNVEGFLSGAGGTVGGVRPVFQSQPLNWEVVTAAKGSGTAHPNMQPSLPLPFYIRALP